MSLHGGDIYKIYRENGKKVIDYSANINSLGFPKKLKKNINNSPRKYRHTNLTLKNKAF